MTDARPQPARWQTRNHRVEEQPADWFVKVTCLIDDCGWSTEWRAGYEAAHRVTSERIEEHQRVTHIDGSIASDPLAGASE